MNYSDRKIKDVFVGGMFSGLDKEGIHGAGAEVHFALESRDDPALSGPSVTASLKVDCDAGLPMVDVEALLIEAAHSLLSRFAQEPVEELKALYRRNRDERNAPDPFANLFGEKNQDGGSSLPDERTE